MSTSHICVFAAVAVGLFEGRRGVNWMMVLQVRLCQLAVAAAAPLGEGL